MSDTSPGPYPSLRRRSRWVQVLRLVLPLTALVMLSLLFLLAETVDPERAIEQADFDVLDRARDPRLSGAEIASVTVEGTEIRLIAEVVRVATDGILRFQGAPLVLNIDDADGEVLNARSRSGILDRGAGEFTMENDVLIEAASGYTMETAFVSGLLDQTYLEAPGQVVGWGPAGDLTAGALTVRRDPESGHHVLLFTGGVRLLYNPISEDRVP